MLEETTIIKSKAIFSDDKEHRLLLQKEWDSEKPTAMVIMINPNTADTVNFDMTTMLVLNNVSKLGFGSVNIVNLYSRIMEKLNLRFNGDDELIHDVRERQKYLLELIKQHANKMYQIGKNACHPLTPAVRREWVLEPYEMEETE